MKWLRKSSLDPLAVSMAGAKLGDRLLVIGCSDPLLIAALASKSGLTGRACAVDEDGTVAREAQQIAEREGALIEAVAAPEWRVPYDDGSFDVVVLRSILSAAAANSRDVAPREALRVLRGGGRCVAIDATPRRGLGALFGGEAPAPFTADEASGALVAAGFVAVRTLAEREQMVFVEGVKRNVSR